MQSHDDAAPDRPTAEWINRYAAELLASAPGMHPLDAVRQALQASIGAVDQAREPSPKSGAGHLLPGRDNAS